jgi:hypothetical protein
MIREVHMTVLLKHILKIPNVIDKYHSIRQVFWAFDVIDKYHSIRQVFWAFEAICKKEPKKFSKARRIYT